MRVWIENPFDNLPGEGNRPQRYWLMARAFAAAGHETVLWTSDFSHARKQHRDGCAGAGFDVVLVPTHPYRRNVSLKRVLSHRAYARTWDRLARQRIASKGAPDLLIVSTPPLATGAVALKLRRDFACRLVVDVMDAWPETFSRLLPRALRGLSPLVFAPFYRAAKRLYREADLVTGVAVRYESLVRAAGARDYYLAYHGIDISSQPSTRNAQPSTLNPQRSTRRLVYCGNLGRGYDLATAVRAVAADPALTLDIAGAGDGEASLKALAARCGARDRVRFHGYLAAEPLAELLRSCDVGIIPLEDDSCVGVPYKLADYAAAGLVIASSLDGECGELLRRHNCGAVYRAGDADDLRRAIASLSTCSSPASLAASLDAAHIYSAYVARLSTLNAQPSTLNRS